MRRWPAAIAVVASATLVSCGGEEARVTNGAHDANMQVPEQQRAPVLLLPAANAKQLRPGVFVLTVHRPHQAAPSIETAKSFVLHETFYDSKGHEAGGSVPSTTWSLLGESSRAQLQGMRLGEIRRVWTCSGRPREKCQVKDVEVLSVDVGRAGQNARTNTAGSDLSGVTEPMPVGGDVTAPIVVTRVQPKWPEQITEQRTWLYSLVVTKAGGVRDLRLMRGESGMYSKVTEEALLKWKFKPGTYRGRPVDVRYDITVTIHVR